MEKFKKNIVYIIIGLFPFIDIITSLYVRHFDYNLTPGIIFRGFIFFSCILYTLFKKDIKYKKLNYIFCGLLLIYTIIYFWSRYSGLSADNLFYEISSFFKYWYYPVILVFFMNYIYDKNFDLQKMLKVIIFNLLIYALGIIIPALTNTAFKSYRNDKAGLIGWFYAANEIGAIMAIEYTLLFYFGKKINWWYKIGLAILVILAFSIIGTKVITFSLILTTVIMFLINLIKEKFNFKKKNLLFTIFVLLFSIIVLFNSATVANVFERIHPTNTEEKVIENKTPVEESKPEELKENSVEIKPKKEKTMMEKLFSGRQRFLKKAYSNYKDSSVINKLFGNGFVKEDGKIYKLVEIDFIDILFNYGIVGFVLYFIPLIFSIVIIIKELFLTRKLTYNTFIFGWAVLLALAISSTAGHVLGAPAASFYLALFISLLYYQIKKRSKA